jgi:hypothetical protein
MKGEIPAWKSCGRIVSQERADYWEFMVRYVKPFLAVRGVEVMTSHRSQMSRLQQ